MCGKGRWKWGCWNVLLRKLFLPSKKADLGEISVYFPGKSYLHIMPETAEITLWPWGEIFPIHWGWLTENIESTWMMLHESAVSQRELLTIATRHSHQYCNTWNRNFHNLMRVQKAVLCPPSNDSSVLLHWKRTQFYSKQQSAELKC